MILQIFSLYCTGVTSSVRTSTKCCAYLPILNFWLRLESPAVGSMSPARRFISVLNDARQPKPLLHARIQELQGPAREIDRVQVRPQGLGHSRLAHLQHDFLSRRPENASVHLRDRSAGQGLLLDSREDLLDSCFPSELSVNHFRYGAKG